MAARDGHLDGALGHLLPLDVDEVGLVAREGVRFRAVVRPRGSGAAGVGAREDVGRVAETVDRPDAQAAHDGRLGGVVDGNEEVRHALRAQAHRQRQDAAHGAHLAAERKLAGQRRRPRIERTERGGGRFAGARAAEGAVEPHLPGREQDRHRDGQVEQRAVLVDVGRGEVHRDAAVVGAEARVGDGGGDAVVALAHRRVRQPDHDDLRVAAARDVGLDLDAEGVDARQRSRKQFGKSHGVASPQKRREASG